MFRILLPASRFRPDRAESLRFWLVALLVLTAGYGLRDPWPADEPRFVLVAKTMWESGQWLLPMRGGELYPDKPPLFMWLLAGSYALIRSWTWAFLLPSLLAGLATLALLRDLARRLDGERAARALGWFTLFTLAFTQQIRSAQIDAVLLAFVTASIYAFARFQFLPGNRAAGTSSATRRRPDSRVCGNDGLRSGRYSDGWIGWPLLAGAFAGLGTILKGTGALALLFPLCTALALRWNAGGLVSEPTRLRNLLAVAAGFLLAVSVWLVPLAIGVALDSDGAVRAYAQEILIGQTAHRYVAYANHQKPIWHYAEVLATSWWPLIFALPLLLRVAWRHRARLSGRDAALAWFVGLVLLFFTLSSGKRSLYILPALPAFGWLVARWLPILLRRRGFQRLCLTLGLTLGLLVLAAGLLALVGEPGYERRLAQRYEAAPWGMVALTGGLALTLALGLWASLRRRLGQPRGFAALCGAMTGLWLGYGWLLYPQLDAESSARGLTREVHARLPAGAELGLLSWKEQNLLQAEPGTVIFGFLSPRATQEQQAIDWLAAAPERRWLLVQKINLEACFDAEKAIKAGRSNRRDWYLVQHSMRVTPCRPWPAAAQRWRRTADF